MPQKLGKLQQAWVDALRSGIYKQGRGRLFNEETGLYCCLGVCEHAVCNGAERRVMGLVALSSQTTELMKFHYENAYIIGNKSLKEYLSLTKANDSGNVTFEEIADFVEQNPGTIFLEEA